MLKYALCPAGLGFGPVSYSPFPSFLIRPFIGIGYTRGNVRQRGYRRLSGGKNTLLCPSVKVPFTPTILNVTHIASAIIGKEKGHSHAGRAIALLDNVLIT